MFHILKHKSKNFITANCKSAMFILPVKSGISPDVYVQKRHYRPKQIIKHG